MLRAVEIDPRQPKRLAHVQTKKKAKIYLWALALYALKVHYRLTSGHGVQGNAGLHLLEFPISLPPSPPPLPTVAFSLPPSPPPIPVRALVLPELVKLVLVPAP